MNADQATRTMVKAMQADDEGTARILDRTLHYSSLALSRIDVDFRYGKLLDEDVLQAEYRQLLHGETGTLLMRLLTEADEPLAVWLREVPIPIGHQGTNGGVRIVVETIPLRKVL